MRTTTIVMVLLMTVGLVSAQESASFKLNEHAFNAGGRPEGGSVAASASFRISLDALGDSVKPGLIAGGDYQLGGGFVSAYPPPGEVQLMGFTDHVTLVWTDEPSVGTYRLYRGTIANVGGLAYGDCHESDIVGATTTDADPVPMNAGFFYLVTAANMIAEEGPKGHASSGDERGNPAPCP
jgi:hypothetical protein